MTPMRRAPTTSQAYFGWFVAAPEAVETAARPLRRSRRREVLRTVVVLGLGAWLKDYLDAHRVPEQGDLLAWRRPVPRPRLPLARVERGGPDPTKPCEGCRERPTCRAPCQLLTRLLPPEEVRAYNEVSSPALMTGGGHDEAFLTIPAEWADEPENPFAGTETVDRWNGLVKTYGGKRLRAVIDEEKVLTAEQCEVLRMFLDGLTRKEIGALREVSRQAVHKVVWAAVRTLRRYFARGPNGVPRRVERTEDRHEAGAQRASGRAEGAREKVSRAA